jgi:hypothetical protein
MKFAVFGATGRVGKCVVVEAARRGHDVTALSRHEAELPAGVAWQHGDLSDEATVDTVAGSHDVVVTANGPSRVAGEDPFRFATLIAQVAAAVGSTRLMVVGGAGSLEAAPGIRLVDTPEFPEPYKNEALATSAALDFLRSSTNVDWTYLSPAPLFPAGEPTGSYIVGTDSPAGTSISGEDFAIALIDELENPKHRNQRFTVAAI